MTVRKRRARPANGLAWLNALTNSAPPPPQEVSRIMLHIRAAWQRLRDGVGAWEDLDTVGSAVAVGEVRSEQIGGGEAGIAIFRAAYQSLAAGDSRHAQTGRYGFTGPELAAVDEALELYQQILAESSPNQMERATQETMRRILAARAEAAAKT